MAITWSWNSKHSTIKKKSFNFAAHGMEKGKRCIIGFVETLVMATLSYWCVFLYDYEPHRPTGDCWIESTAYMHIEALTELNNSNTKLIACSFFMGAMKNQHLIGHVTARHLSMVCFSKLRGWFNSPISIYLSINKIFFAISDSPRPLN
jgi:hypothetical protein